MITQTRMVTQHAVLKVEFSMGRNDTTDIRCGGPSTLGFWVYTDLPRDAIDTIATDKELQSEIVQRGGDGSYTITEEWHTGPFVNTAEVFKAKCLERAREF